MYFELFSRKEEPEKDTFGFGLELTFFLSIRLKLSRQCRLGKMVIYSEILDALVKLTFLFVFSNTNLTVRGMLVQQVYFPTPDTANNIGLCPGYIVLLIQ